MAPRDSQDIFRRAIHILGADGLGEVFHKSDAQIYNYARGITIDPLAKVEALVDDLRIAEAKGGLELARVIATRIARRAKLQTSPLEQVKPDKPTLEAECLDDLPALAAYHQAVFAKDANYTDVLVAFEGLQREARETLEKFKEKMLAEHA